MIGVRVGFSMLGLFLLGCANDDEEFQYDREDMEAAVFGTWTGTFTPEGSTAVPMTLEIRSHDEVARSLACESRNFSERPGAPGLDFACSSGSTLAVSATLVRDDAASPTDLDGFFDVAGYTFEGGYLWLGDRAVGSGSFTASLRGDEWKDCRYGVGPEVKGSCTLDARVEK